jgi:hypothetical protein
VIVIEDIDIDPVPVEELLTASSNELTLDQELPAFKEINKPPVILPAYILASLLGSIAIPRVLPPTLSGPSYEKVKAPAFCIISCNVCCLASFNLSYSTLPVFISEYKDLYNSSASFQELELLLLISLEGL